MIPKLITWTQSTPTQVTSLKSILIVHLDTGLSSGLSRSDFPTKEDLLNVQINVIVLSVPQSCFELLPTVFNISAWFVQHIDTMQISFFYAFLV